MQRVLIALLLIALLVALGVPLALWIGAYASLDHDFAHSRATAELDAFDPATSASHTVTLSLTEANAMTFRTRAAGFGGDRGNVILLHGFPESSAMYTPMIRELARAGYRVVAPDQRGYSPGARPADLDAYTTDKLAADVFAIADAVGFDRFHLVGHDWGAAIGWLMVFGASPRIRSWSALSIPHMGAYAAAITEDSDQRERSAYLGFFQLPWLPEALMAFNGFAMMRNLLYAEHGAGIVDEYVAIFSEPGALTAALNWYRASRLSAPPPERPVTIPTAYIWGNRDPAVGDRAVQTQRQYFDGNLWETELDTGHWLMETEARAVTDAVPEHIGQVEGDLGRGQSVRSGSRSNPGSIPAKRPRISPMLRAGPSAI